MTAFDTSDAFVAPAWVKPLDVLGLLRRRLQDDGTALALRHKQRGQWRAWRWDDVAVEVKALSQRLADVGVGKGTRLAVSGACEPRLLFTLLAAQTLEARVLLVPLVAGQGAATLPQASVFWTNDRAQARAWQSSVGRNGEGLLCAPLPVHGAGNRIALQTLHPPQPVVVVTLADHPAAGAGLLWYEEGSEWPEGLQRLLRFWLVEGLALALPETPAAAVRDRHEVAPTRLLLSSTRLAALAAEIEARLPLPGSLARRLADWSRQGPGLGVRGVLRRRIRRLLGFQRLVAVEQLAAAGDSVWLAELERAA